MKDHVISGKVKCESNWFKDILTWNSILNMTEILSVVNILRKQGVPAPWVIIHLLYHSSGILRTTQSLIILICKFHSTLWLKIHFLWQKYSTEVNKTECGWRHSFRIAHEHDNEGTSLNSWDIAHTFFWGKWTG